MRTGNVEVNRYYHLSGFHINLSNEGLSEKALTEVINYKLEEAVKLRLQKRCGSEKVPAWAGGWQQCTLWLHQQIEPTAPAVHLLGCFRQTGINEEAFADAMALTAGAIQKTQPTGRLLEQQCRFMHWMLQYGTPVHTRTI